MKKLFDVLNKKLWTKVVIKSKFLLFNVEKLYITEKY